MKGFQNIPLNELASKASQLDKNKEVIVICQSGMRSKQAAKVLKIRISARYQCFRRDEWFVRRKCKMKEMTAKELEEKLLRKEAVNIIDVREVEEVAEGKIPEACNIPLGLLEFRMHELDKKKEYIIVCCSGGRSARAVQFLEGYGFRVINMVGGMLAWEGKVE